MAASTANNGQPEIPPDSPVEIPPEPFPPDIPPGGPLEEPPPPAVTPPERPVEIPPNPGE